MQEKLIEILKKYSLNDIINIEEADRQFLALKNLFENIGNKDYFLSIVLVNALLSYQLSSSGELYWEEFSEFAIKYKFSKVFRANEIEKFFLDFLPESKGNKRLLNMKKKRLEKIINFLDVFHGKEKIFYEKIIEFREFLMLNLDQKKDDKTVVFALKMFHYGARIYFNKFILAPFEIEIPVDSRILKITKIYNDTPLKTIDFWNGISREVGIPPLHLDALLWVKCNDFICF